MRKREWDGREEDGDDDDLDDDEDDADDDHDDADDDEGERARRRMRREGRGGRQAGETEKIKQPFTQGSRKNAKIIQKASKNIYKQPKSYKNPK